MFFRFSWVVVATVAFTGCAARHARDHSNPNYYNAYSFPAAGRAPGEREGRIQGGLGEAAVGVFASAVSLAANPDYYREDFLTGRCLCRFAPEGEFDLPCANVTVLLADESGKELSRIFTSDGEFVFAAEPNRAYRLRVVSQRYALRSAGGLVRAGDDIVLPLVGR